MLKFMFNALIQQQRPLHTAERHRPTMFHTATVRPKRSGPIILYNTPLIQPFSMFETRVHRGLQMARHVISLRFVRSAL